VKPISEELADLRALTAPELVERYVEVFGRLPRVKQPSWLLRRLAWRVQEQRLGGLSDTAKARLEVLIAEIDLPLDGARKQIKPARRGGTTLGTTVSRTWKGLEIRATAVEGGWEHEGVRYRSLTAIAKQVTGTHWNGKLFFGLTRRAQ
jgi:DUF2924 family protein